MKDIIFRIPFPEEFQQLIQDEIKKGFEAISKSSQNSAHQEIQYLTRKETADCLKITLPTLRTWTKSGKLKSYVIGRRVLYNPVEIRQALSEQSKYLRK